MFLETGLVVWSTISGCEFVSSAESATYRDGTRLGVILAETVACTC